MNYFRATFAGALLLFLITTGFGMSVKSDYQKNFDFSRLRTFTFRTERSSQDPLSANAIEANRIQSALSAQLGLSGYSPVSENPDFVVAFYERIRQRTQIESTGIGPGFGFGRGFGWGYGIPFRDRWRWGYGPDIWTVDTTQDCIMADFIDPASNELIWRGVAKDDIKGIALTDKQANDAAKDLVKQFVKDAKKANKQRS
jgi:hypothetical protein